MLRLSLIGFIGSDATVREVGDQSVISFNVAHDDTYVDRNNVRVERTTWVSCSYWRPHDRVAVAQYLRKGTQVYVEGAPTTRAYTAANGENRTTLDCRVMNLQLLGKKTQDGPPPVAVSTNGQAYTANGQGYTNGNGNGNGNGYSASAQPYAPTNGNGYNNAPVPVATNGSPSYSSAQPAQSSQYVAPQSNYDAPAPVDDDLPF